MSRYWSQIWVGKSSDGKFFAIRRRPLKVLQLLRKHPPARLFAPARLFDTSEYVGTAKMRLRVNLKNHKQTAENYEQILVNFIKLVKYTASQTHFCCTNIGSNMNRFSSTANSFENFQS